MSASRYAQGSAKFAPAILIALALVAAPLVAEVQQPTKIVQIGILSAFSPSAREEAFRQELRELGYVEGQNVMIQARYSEGQFSRLPELAVELAVL